MGPISQNGYSKEKNQGSALTLYSLSLSLSLGVNKKPSVTEQKQQEVFRKALNEWDNTKQCQEQHRPLVSP